MTRTPFDLSGRLAVVSGARRGIGAAIAEGLAAAGADIIGVSSSLEPDGGEVGERVRALGRSFSGHAVDFADRPSVVAFADVLDRLPRPVDVLVNNAGTIDRAPAVDHPTEWFDRVIEVDLASQFVLTQRVGRGMLDRGHGKIIFTASLLSFQGGVDVVGYAAAKSGLTGLTKALSNEWASQGVTVNAVAPGYIATDNTLALRDDDARSQAILDRIPARRWGVPADVAGTFVFLASSAADYVSGVTIPVDGGWLAR